MLQSHATQPQPAPVPEPILDLMSEFPDFAGPGGGGQPLSAVQQLINKRMEALGKNAKALSHACGRNAAYINQFIGRGKPRVLPEDVVQVLARELGVEAWKLRTGGYQGMPDPDPEAPPLRPAAVLPPVEGPIRLSVAPPVSVPLYKMGSQLDAQPVAMMPPVQSQGRSRQAFTVSMTADLGIIRRGNLVFCDGAVAVAPGDTVMVVDHNRLAGMGELVATDGDKVTVRNFSYDAQGQELQGVVLAKVVGLDLS